MAQGHAKGRQGTKDRYQRATVCTQQQHAIACRVFTLLFSHLLLLLLLLLLRLCYYKLRAIRWGPFSDLCVIA